MSTTVRPRFVVLGASNVTRGFGSLVARVRGAHDEPVEILAAHGRGRSYGLTSRLLWMRELGAIDTCGLWEALARGSAPTTALVCDIGNDLAYGVPPETIVGWVARALDRLLENGARVVLVGLPLASLDRMGRVRFELARNLIFPGRRIELRALLGSAHDLDLRLEQAAHARRVAFVRPDGAWFGVDPVHARRGDRERMWSAYLRPLGLPGAKPRHALSERWLLLGARPAQRRLLGIAQLTPQPCVWFEDGGSIAIW